MNPMLRHLINPGLEIRQFKLRENQNGNSMCRQQAFSKINTCLRWTPAFAALIWISCILPCSTQAVESAMRPYSIDLPGHLLRFSLPKEITRENSSLWVEKRFDPTKHQLAKEGFCQIAGLLYDFKGLTVHGSLKVHIMVQKRAPEYPEEIASLDALDRYVRWKISSGTNAKGCIFGRASLNGADVIVREWNSFDDAQKDEREHLKIFSFPLDGELYLEFGFNVKLWAAKYGNANWRKQAEALSEMIQATVVLSPQVRFENVGLGDVLPKG